MSTSSQSRIENENCWTLKILKNLIFDFAGKAPEVQSLELSFPVTSAHFQNNQVSSMVEIFRQRQIYKKRQRQCKDNDIETKIKKTQILILTWYTGAPEMFSHDSRPLLEDSRCNTKPGASKTASDQRRFVPYIYLLFLITNLFISLYLCYILVRWSLACAAKCCPPWHTSTVVFVGNFEVCFFRLFYRFPLFCPTHPSSLQTKTGKCKSHAYSYSDILKGNVAERENGNTSSQPFR